MTYDPNDNRPDLRDRRTEHVTTTNVDARSRRGSWMPWVAVLAVLLIGAFIWSNMGAEPGTDPGTTASTTPEASETAPEPVPAAPAAPNGVVNDAAPAAPAAPAGNGG